MSLSSITLRRSPVRRVVAAAALMTACVAASALPQFTFTPSGAGLTGGAITADNILFSDFATITSGPGGTFTETGFLSITGFQLGGTNLTPAGLNTDYGLYIAFTGTGTTTTNNPATAVNTGTFDTLNYTLYGYNGTATFGFSGDTPTESASGEVVLATGSLKSGTVVTVPAGDGKFNPSANANLNFWVDPAAAAFFTSPNPFYNVALTSFTNTTSQVTLTGTGFRISQGSGSLNFEPLPVPEPSSTAMLLAGLGVAGLLYRRKMGSQ
ncbi:MAG TPA: flocculation-associated PEP-CTERM protein PepA [Roseateles sp.]